MFVDSLFVQFPHIYHKMTNWFELILHFWGWIQQGEAKKALEVLQKPSVPVDLQVRTNGNSIFS